IVPERDRRGGSGRFLRAAGGHEAHCDYGLAGLGHPQRDLHKESRVKPLSPFQRYLSTSERPGCSPAAVLLSSSPPRCHSAACWPDLATAGLNRETLNTQTHTQTHR
ncbi:hypothetical protein D9C73_028007, partial [Scomber scombrus]